MTRSAPVSKWVEAVGRDVRYAIRALARTPSFTIPAVASLALGIAVNTIMFSVVNSLLLEPLGPGGDALVRIGRANGNERAFRSATWEELEYLRGSASSFSALAGHQIESLTMGDVDAREAIAAEVVAGDYFSMLGASPRLGRGFAPEDDRPGASAVAVLSHRFWRRRFESDTAAVGRTLWIVAHPVTIVGIAPPGFSGTFPGVDVDVWIPVGTRTAMIAGEASGISLMLIGRLRHGVTRTQAEAELRGLAHRLAERGSGRGPGRTFVVGSARGAHPLVASGVRPLLLMLTAVVAVVLLIACANVAGLLLARASARSGEVAVRFALGARRSQLMAQLLAESLVLAALGGVAGVALSVWPLAFLNQLSLTGGPTGTGIFLDLRLDVRVLALAATATWITAVVFGLAPALRMTRTALSSPLRWAHAPIATGGSRLQDTIIVVQACASFVLLVASTMLFRSIRNIEHLDVGFDREEVMIVSFDRPRESYDQARRAAFVAELLARVRAHPAVQGAALADFVPMGDRRGHPVVLRTPGATVETGERRATVHVARVSDGYFATMDQPVVRGRDFTPQDRSPATRVAIVNQAMSRRYWPGRDPLGQRIGLGEDSADVEIIGVAHDARYSSFGGAIAPLVFIPVGDAGTLHVRTALPPPQALRRIQGLAEEIDAVEAAHLEARPLRDIMRSSESLLPVRIARVVFGVAAVIALLLAAGGLYGLVGYTLERRRREIGIRVALGADRGSVFRVITGRAFQLTTIGTIVGAGLAAALLIALSGLLYGLDPLDPSTFVGVAAVLVLVTLAAGYAAARRGLRVDPTVVLKQD